MDREREIAGITEKLLSAQPNSLQGRLRDIRSYVLSEMRNLRDVLNSDAARVRAKLAKHIEKITLTPEGEHYMASGTWNFVGRGSIDGAGGRNWTERLPLSGHRCMMVKESVGFRMAVSEEFEELVARIV